MNNIHEKTVIVNLEETDELTIDEIKDWIASITTEEFYAYLASIEVSQDRLWETIPLWER